MTAYMNSMSYQSSHCGTSAAAATSARLLGILGTALFAVSILFVRLLGM